MIMGEVMKKIIINKLMDYIKKNANYNDTKLKEIQYGLTSVYLTISKLILIMCLSSTPSLRKYLSNNLKSK